MKHHRLMRLQPLWRLILWLLLACAACFWVFHIPSRPQTIFDAIPDNACFVHVSKDPGLRWAAIKNNPLVIDCMSSNLWNTIEHLAGYARAKENNAASLIGQTVFACVPHSMRMPTGGWFAAAWLGTRSHLVRWWFTLAAPDGWQTLDGCGSRAAWRTSTPVDNNGRYISLSICDGILLLCFSKDPAGVAQAMAAHDKLMPSLASAKAIPQTMCSEAIQNSAEQGWFTAQSHYPSAHDPISLSYEFNSLDSSNIDLILQYNSILPGQTTVHQASELTGLAQLAGANPALLAIAPVETLTVLNRSLKASAWSLSMITLLQGSVVQTSNAPLLIAAATGTDTAGFGRAPLRMPLPAILAAAPAGTATWRMPAILSSITDILSAAHDIELVVDAVQKNNVSFFQIKAPSIKSIIKPDNSDLPAFAYAGGWLIAGSSGSHLASRIQEALKPNNNMQPQEWERSMPAEPVLAWVWADLEQTGKAVEDMLALWRVNLIWQNTDNKTLNNLARAKTIIHAMRRMGKLAISARPSATNSSEWRLRIGTNMPPTF